MPLFATADAPLALALLTALLTTIEMLKWIRLRRQAAAEREVKEALGSIIAGCIFTAMFVAISGFWVLIGQPFALPNFASFSDWLYVVLFLLPLVIEGSIFAGELRSLRRTSR